MLELVGLLAGIPSWELLELGLMDLVLVEGLRVSSSVWECSSL